MHPVLAKGDGGKIDEVGTVGLEAVGRRGKNSLARDARCLMTPFGRGLPSYSEWIRLDLDQGAQSNFVVQDLRRPCKTQKVLKPTFI
ncbi:hypothetical protein L596_015944 [Steinernema carpocapsae]|uniref:Uncharacterized protein n=1 Tax=Steinernema carpocapsae TaxID=34508 RepID=A0A4U5NHQ2_STECR|nr:hypothetical protein L596_015944 [Steinernema carpocapsae]